MPVDHAAVYHAEGSDPSPGIDASPEDLGNPRRLIEMFRKGLQVTRYTILIGQFRTVIGTRPRDGKPSGNGGHDHNDRNDNLHTQARPQRAKI